MIKPARRHGYLATLWLGLALGVVTCLPAGAQTWDHLAPTGIFPTGPVSPVSVFDASLNQLILFGDATHGTGVWRLSLGATPSWTQIAPGGTAPGGEGSAVYDPTNSRMIIFVYGGANPVFVLNNANGANGTPAWIQLNPTGGPPPVRTFSSAVYDSTNNRMIVFGGESGDGTVLNDVWVLTEANGMNGTPTWIQLSPAGGPPPGRSFASAVYDATNNRMIVFGGAPQTFYLGLNDVWVLSNANGLGGTPTWTQLSPTGTAPEARSGTIAIFDPSTDQMVLFAGTADGTIPLSDIWTLSNANNLGGTPTWTQRFPGGNPGSGVNGAYNPSNDELVIIGGGGFNGSLGDTWVLDDANWAPAANLAITALTGPTTIAAGSQVNVSMTVANQGTATSEPFAVEFYWSQNTTITPAAIDSGSGCSGLTLAVGSHTTCNVLVNVPASLTPGTWYLGAIADPSMKIPELSRTGNSRVSDSGPAQVSVQSCNTVTAMTFAAIAGGAAPGSQVCTVNSGAALTATASTLAGGNWLSATLSQTNSPATLTVSASPSGLGVGSYNGSVTIRAAGTTILSFPATLTVTQAPVSLGIYKSHSGNFTQGLQGGAYTVDVFNASGGGATSGALTVTENVPSGLTLASMSGSGWTCTSGGNTCTRSDALAGGSGYPPITVTVNVATGATSPQVNSVSVSGGGSTTASASDSTTITTGGVTSSVQPYLIGTVAGTGASSPGGSPGGFSGDGGLATLAQINEPTGVAVDSAGNLYIADSQNNRIRKVAAATGIITTVAGGGSSLGDNGPATSAQLSATDVAVDSAGNVYIADSGNNRIRKVTVATGIITTVAGGGSSLGDNGPATSAQLNNPQGVAVDASGNIYIADTNNDRVRKVTAATGIITTVAGNGSSGYSGDGGPATSAQLAVPNGVAVDSFGNLYIGDTTNVRVRQVGANGIITTVAGNGTPGHSGDGGLATNAQLLTPVRVAVDGSGNLYIADFFNEETRKVVLATDIITVLAGQGSNAISQPWGVAVGQSGQIFIADEFNSVVTLVNDSGAPSSEITAANISSSGHLTFNLLIQSSSGSQQNAAAHESMSSMGAIKAQPTLRPATSNGSTFAAGGTVTYTETLAADPSSPNASDVVVGSTLPPTWTITGCTTDSGGTCSATGGSTINVTYPVYDTRHPPTFTIVGDGPAGDDVSISSNSSTGASASQLVTVSPGAAISLDFSGPAGIAAGQQITYNVVLNNSGTAGAKLAGDPLKVTITLDSALTGVSIDTSADPLWTCTQTGLTIVCTDTSTVAAGGSTNFTLTGNVGQSAVSRTLTTSAVLTFAGQVLPPETPNTYVNPALPTAVTLSSPAQGATGVPTSVSLTWGAASGATSYDVFLGTTNPPPMVFNTTATSYSPPVTLSVGPTYYWQVNARNSSGSTPSAIWSFTTGAGAPPAVTVFSPSQGVTGVSTTASLTWGAVTGATSYSVQFGTSNPPPAATTTSGTSYSPSMSANTTYYWSVTAVNASGSTPSAVWSFTTAGGGAPPAVTVFSPSQGATGVSTTVSLTWGAVAGAASYDVYFGTSSTPAFANNTAGLTYSPGTLNPGTLYYWQVNARNSSGTTPSAIWSFSTAGGTVPGAVTLLLPAQGATAVSTGATLTWVAASGATSYSLSLNGGLSGGTSFITGITGTSYTPGNLTPGTIYDWYVTAVNASGSTPSAVWSFSTGTATTSGYRFVPVTPCRIMDTRGATGMFGGPSIAGGATRSVPIPLSSCNIPSTAQAYSLNITVVPPGPLTYLSIWPTGQAQPVVSTLNSLDGRIVANAAIVPAGTNGAISVYASNTTDVIIDINGYFAPASTSGSMSFYAATPCRVVDTRGATGAFGGPFLSGGSTRNFPIPSSSCGIPSAAQAYSLNITVIPHVALQYLSTWPSGQSQPLVSTLNSLDGSIVANAAIVPAGTGGAVSVFVTNDTDLIIDINGYFAPAGSAGALSLYTLTPCRIVDTRGATGTFGGPSLPANGSRSFPIPSSACSVPSTAQAYSLNVTVVPPGTLTYLTAWPTGQTQPVVSTLNSPGGKVVANAAIVPAGTSGPGGVSIFVSNATDVILDINAYFAQ